MAIRLASYLKRNRFGVFYLRRVIPPDLRRFFPIREISRSAGATSRRDAVSSVRRFGASLELLFDRLRDMETQTSRNKACLSLDPLAEAQ